MGVRELLGLGKKQHTDMVDERLATDTGAEERVEPELTQPPDISDDDLDSLALQRVLSRGKVNTLLEMAGHNRQTDNVDTIPGTDIPKPRDYDAMGAEEVAVYVANHVRQSASKEIDEKVRQTEERFMGLTAPVLRQQAISTVAGSLDESERQYAEQALKDIESRFGKKISVLSDQEAWLVAQRAKAIASEAAKKSTPHLSTESGGVPYDANPAAVRYMEAINAGRSADNKVDYATALKWAKEDGNA